LPVEEKRDLRVADDSPNPRCQCPGRLAPEGHGCRVDDALPLITTSVVASPPHSKFETIGSGYIAVAYIVGHANFFKKKKKQDVGLLGSERSSFTLFDVDVLKGQLTN
jgi:hypothetical protein